MLLTTGWTEAQVISNLPTDQRQSAGTVSLCETPRRLRGFQTVTKTSVHKVAADFTVLHHHQRAEERVAPVWSACGRSPDRTGCPWRPCRGSGRAPPWAAPGTPQSASGWSCSGSLWSSPGNTERHEGTRVTKLN